MLEITCIKWNWYNTVVQTKPVLPWQAEIHGSLDSKWFVNQCSSVRIWNEIKHATPKKAQYYKGQKNEICFPVKLNDMGGNLR